MADAHRRRRRHLLAAALACCALVALLVAARAVPLVASYDRGITAYDRGITTPTRDHRRRGLMALEETAGQPATSVGIKRVRAHRIPDAVALKSLIGGHTAGEGITARDAHGLRVEIAAPHSSTPTDAIQSTTSAADTAAWVPPTTKIINGLPYSRAAHPYLARLHWKYPGDNPDDPPFGTAFCGGSLIAPNVVLTAAHCLGDYEEYVDLYDVKLRRARTYGIERSVVHPMYEEGTFGYDFGLVVLEENHLEVATEQNDNVNGGEAYWTLVDAIQYDWENAPPLIRLHRYPTDEERAAATNVGCGSLSVKEAEEIATLTVMGYGATRFGSGGASDPSLSLQGADVHYVPNEECNDRYVKAPDFALPPPKTRGNIITDDMLCAWDPKEGQDACSGDSGGPLVTRLSATSGNGEAITLWQQVGIVSWGIGCALSEYPGVYSRVAHEIDWIEGAICGANVKRSRGTKRGDDGLSPLSCITNENGERHLRDYSVEAALRRGARGGSGRAKVEATDRARKGGQRQQKQEARARMASCELLEGTTAMDSSGNVPPTNRPTKPPKTARPTKEKRDPTDADKGSDGADIDPSATCPADNRKDVQSFHVGNANNPREKSCRWVRRRCRRRCGEYANCCPETCALEKCRG